MLIGLNDVDRVDGGGACDGLRTWCAGGESEGGFIGVPVGEKRVKKQGGMSYERVGGLF